MNEQSRASVPPLPEPGTVFADRYRLRRKLAAGGMGAVYEADDLTTSQPVAVKLLHPELSTDREIHRRFRRESSILASLNHPAIVAIRDVGTDDAGRAYTVMELLEGETLHDRIRRTTRLPPAELAPIVDGIASALAAAHEHGVIHGDVKPANVFLIDGRGAGVSEVKLVDFGLSKVHGLERLTRTGEIIGTPMYMAPELLTGETDIDHRVDIYALGVVMYQALAGRTPFRERVPGKLLYEIVLGKGEPLRSVCPELSPAIEACIAHAMAPKRDDRPTSALEVAAELRRAASA